MLETLKFKFCLSQSPPLRASATPLDKALSRQLPSDSCAASAAIWRSRSRLESQWLALSGRSAGQLGPTLFE
jgi:hypothetical protein